MAHVALLFFKGGISFGLCGKRYTTIKKQNTNTSIVLIIIDGNWIRDPLLVINT